MPEKKQIKAFIETNMLIWGVREDATRGQEDQIKKAQNLIGYLTDHSAKLMTSTICLGELLTGVSPDKHAPITDTIKKDFMLYPYDNACAVKAAQLWKIRIETIENLREKNKGEPGYRNKIKADIMIVATALINGAEVICTNDTDIKTIAGDLIKVILLDKYEPQPNTQEDMFGVQSRAVH